MGMYNKNMEDKLFWQVEAEYLEKKYEAEQKACQATNLKEALDSGLNEIWLMTDKDVGYEFVGYARKGGYDLAPPFDAYWDNGKKDGLECTCVQFSSCDISDDGFLQGYFNKVKED